MRPPNKAKPVITDKCAHCGGTVTEDEARVTSNAQIVCECCYWGRPAKLGMGEAKLVRTLINRSVPS